MRRVKKMPKWAENYLQGGPQILKNRMKSVFDASLASGTSKMRVRKGLQKKHRCFVVFWTLKHRENIINRMVLRGTPADRGPKWVHFGPDACMRLTNRIKVVVTLARESRDLRLCSK